MSPLNGNSQDKNSIPKAAAYCRISTLVHGQDINNQIEPIKQVAAARGFELVKVYKDEGISGATERRKGLDQMLADAKRGAFKILVVMELSRIARDVRHLLNTLHELHQVGVTLVSIREGIEFNDSPFSKGMVTMIGLLVTIERDLLKDRIKTALALRKQTSTVTGWKCGRPTKVTPEIESRIVALRSSGKSLREIAKELDLSKTAVLRVVQKRNSERGSDE